MATKDRKPYQSKDWLLKEYRNKDKTMKEMGEMVGVTNETIRYWMEKHGIHRGPNDSPTPLTVTLVYDERGYGRWYNRIHGETHTCYVHQLLAIAKGHDPSEVLVQKPKSTTRTGLSGTTGWRILPYSQERLTKKFMKTITYRLLSDCSTKDTGQDSYAQSRPTACSCSPWRS